MNNSETLLPGIYWGREKCMSHYPGLLAKPVFLDALIPMQWEIPVYVVSFNNPTFVKKMIAQLLCYNSTVVVVDTGSTYPPLLDFLAQFQQSTGQISIRRIQGITYGHIPYDWYRKVIANGLSTPRFAALTDADLTFNRNLPPNFLQVLAYLNLKLSAKVGFALDLTKRNLFWKRAYYKNTTIYDWEMRFWDNKAKFSFDFKNLTVEGYKVDIDSTFAVYDLLGKHKCLLTGCRNPFDGFRVSGNFSAIHVPWFRNFYKSWDRDEFEAYLNISSNAGSTMLGYFQTHGFDE